MKAAVYTKYGPPDVVQIKEVEKPSPKDNEVLIKIQATTVNRTDCGFRKPEYPLIIRLVNGIFKPKRKILARADGRSEAVGKDVEAFKTGDQFSLTGNRFGAHARLYACLRKHQSLLSNRTMKKRRRLRRRARLHLRK
jgi:NADPH:quinone reductase-like Zn-dependent oxidoreductase